MSNAPALQWRHFRADALGDATAYARQIGRVAVMDSAGDRGTVLVMAANNTALRLAIAALNLGRDVVKHASVVERSLWLSGIEAAIARDYCAAMEAATPRGIGR